MEKRASVRWLLPLLALLTSCLTLAFFLGRCSTRGFRVETERPVPRQPSVSSVQETVSRSAEAALSETENRLDLNTATKQQLMELPGIGEKTAQSILDYRKTVGGFCTVEQLKEVSGIGNVRYETLRDLVYVEDAE